MLHQSLRTSPYQTPPTIHAPPITAHSTFHPTDCITKINTLHPIPAYLAPSSLSNLSQFTPPTPPSIRLPPPLTMTLLNSPSTLLEHSPPTKPKPAVLSHLTLPSTQRDSDKLNIHLQPNQNQKKTKQTKTKTCCLISTLPTQRDSDTLQVCSRLGL